MVGRKVASTVLHLAVGWAVQRVAWRAAREWTRAARMVVS
jgi:hypothetical protein